MPSVSYSVLNVLGNVDYFTVSYLLTNDWQEVRLSGGRFDDSTFSFSL